MSADEFELDRIGPTSDRAHAVGFQRQVMAADLVTRGDGWERGVRSVLLSNDRIAIEVVVDRGMDVASARVRQLPIAWRSPTEIVAPWFVENTGFGPHRSFFGGLLTTCGFDHIGAPTARSAERFGYAARLDEILPMHGRASGSPARLVGYGVRETADGGLQAWAEGVVTQVAVFGEHVAMTRTISIDFGNSTVRVRDSFANEGYVDSPLALLYHVNVGWPVVAPTAEVRVAGSLLRGDADFPTVRAATPGTQEKTWLHAPDRDADGWAGASIVNPQVDAETAAGLRVRWKGAVLPHLVQWQIANVAGHYAVALEPTTLAVDTATGDARFPTLAPGETVSTEVDIELLHGPRGSRFETGGAA